MGGDDRSWYYQSMDGGPITFWMSGSLTEYKWFLLADGMEPQISSTAPCIYLSSFLRGPHMSRLDLVCRLSTLFVCLERCLLEAGANPNGGLDGNTALHRVTSREMAEILLAAGADPNSSDHLGFTPLHDATLWGYLSVVQVSVRESNPQSWQCVPQ